MKDKISKRLFLLFVIAMIIIAVVMVNKQNNDGQAQPTQTVEEKNYRTELKIGINAMDIFDPITSTNKDVQNVTKLIYEPLITINENFKAEGVLAEEWAKTAENAYIIKLRQGIKWHSGNEFTAEDVKYTIDKIKQTNNSIYKDNIKNISNITIVDNYTIKLELLENEAFFEYNLIFPIESFSDYTSSKETLPSGTGLYKIYQNNNNEIELIRNPYKENAEEIQIKSIQIKNYNTMGELYNDFKIGNIDFFETDNNEYSKYIGTLGYNVNSYHGRKFNFLSFNTNQSALYNIEVRKAISYAIDKNLINSNVYNNKYYISNYILDYNNWLYNENSTSSGYNPDQSKKILEENGWEYIDQIWQKNIDNKNVKLEFNFLVSSSNSDRIKVAESIKEQLEEIGIKLNIMQVSSINNYIENKNYDIALLEVTMGISPDISIFFGENNLANYCNEEVQMIMDEIKELDNDNSIKEKYNKILEIYKNDIPYIGLLFNTSNVIYNSKMTGSFTPNWFNVFYHIENWKIEE